MRVLLDTNVILDFLLERQPYFEAANELMEMIALGLFDGCISSITPINVFYVGRKEIGGAKIRQGISDLLTVLEICPVTDETLSGALSLPFSDYEDAVQYASATENGLDSIVTRNVDDYKNATLPAFSPADFLARVRSSQGPS